MSFSLVPFEEKVYLWGLGEYGCGHTRVSEEKEGLKSSV